MITGLFECFIGKYGSPCWHHFCLWSSGVATCPNFQPHFDKVERQKFVEIAIGASLESFYYDRLHSFVGKDENINLAAPLITSHIDVSSEKQLCEDFIAHSKEVSCTMNEVSREFDKFYDSFKKEIRKIIDSVLIWENTGQRKPVFWHILCSVDVKDLCKNCRNF